MTKKIRIAVAVDGSGSWNAAGGDRPFMESNALEVAVGGLDSVHPLHAVVWIEAEIPIPQEIKGRRTYNRVQRRHGLRPRKEERR